MIELGEIDPKEAKTTPVASRAVSTAGTAAKKRKSMLLNLEPEECIPVDDTFPIQTMEQQMKVFDRFTPLLKASTIGKKTSQEWIWFVTVCLLICMFTCTSNMLDETRSYRNVPFGLVLIYLHLMVPFTRFSWRRVVMSEQWRQLMNFSLTTHSTKVTDRITLLLYVFYIGTIVVSGIIYMGWFVPIFKSILYPLPQEERPAPYGILILHGISLSILIVPWVFVFLGNAIMFNVFTVAAHASLDTLADSMTQHFTKAAEESVKRASIVGQSISSLESSRTHSPPDSPRSLHPSSRFPVVHDSSSRHEPSSRVLPPRQLSIRVPVVESSLCIQLEPDAPEANRLMLHSSPSSSPNATSRYHTSNDLLYSLDSSSHSSSSPPPQPRSESSSSSASSSSAHTQTQIGNEMQSIHTIMTSQGPTELGFEDPILSHINYGHLNILEMFKECVMVHKYFVTICNAISLDFVLWIVLGSAMFTIGTIDMNATFTNPNTTYASVFRWSTTENGASNDWVFHCFQDALMMVGAFINAGMLWGAAGLSGHAQRFFDSMAIVQTRCRTATSDELFAHHRFMEFLRDLRIGYYVYGICITPGRAIVVYISTLLGPLLVISIL